MPPVRDSITVKKGRHALPAECLFPVQLALCGHVFRTVGPFSHSYNESLTGLGSGLRALSLTVSLRPEGVWLPRPKGVFRFPEVGRKCLAPLGAQLLGTLPMVVE